MPLKCRRCQSSKVKMIVQRWLKDGDQWNTYECKECGARFEHLRSTKKKRGEVQGLSREVVSDSDSSNDREGLQGAVRQVPSHIRG